MSDYDEQEYLAAEAEDAYFNQRRDVRCSWACPNTAHDTEAHLRANGWHLGKYTTLCPDHADRAQAIAAQPVPF